MIAQHHAEWPMAKLKVGMFLELCPFALLIRNPDILWHLVNLTAQNILIYLCILCLLKHVYIVYNHQIILEYKKGPC